MNYKQKLLLIIALAVIIRVTFIVLTPVEWNPGKKSLQAFNDEASHVNYVRYLMINKSLPVQTANLQDKDAFVRNEFEYFQPPLNYIMCASFAFLFDVPPKGKAVVYFSRVFAALLGIISIILFFFLMKQNFSEQTALFFTLIYSLLPIHIRHTSAFSNDILLWVLMLAALFFINKKLQQSFATRDFVVESILLGLLLLTKIAILPVIACYFFFGLFHSAKRREWLIPAVVSFLFLVPYMIRNYLVYNQLMALEVAEGKYEPVLLSFSPYIIFRFLRGVLITFVFPYDTLQIPFALKVIFYVLWSIFFLFVLYQCVKVLYRFARERKLDEQNIYNILFIVSVGGLIYYNLTRFQPEYRTIFYNIPIILLLLKKEFIQKIKSQYKLAIYSSVIIPLILVLIFSIITLGK